MSSSGCFAKNFVVSLARRPAHIFCCFHLPSDAAVTVSACCCVSGTCARCRREEEGTRALEATPPPWRCAATEEQDFLHNFDKGTQKNSGTNTRHREKLWVELGLGWDVSVSLEVDTSGWRGEGIFTRNEKPQ